MTRIPVNRIAWRLKLGPSEAQRYCERLGYPVTEDGWVSDDALDAIRIHIELHGNTEDLIKATDPELPIWLRIWNRMSSRQRRALNRKYARRLEETPADAQSDAQQSLLVSEEREHT